MAVSVVVSSVGCVVCGGVGWFLWVVGDVSIMTVVCGKERQGTGGTGRKGTTELIHPPPYHFPGRGAGLLACW
jgi:hypothetical protein